MKNFEFIVTGCAEKWQNVDVGEVENQRDGVAGRLRSEREVMEQNPSYLRVRVI